MALLVLVVHADVAERDAVEANVLEAGDLPHRPQVSAIGGAGLSEACPEPNICSQKCGKGCAGARASMVMVSVGACASSGKLRCVQRSVEQSGSE